MPDPSITWTGLNPNLIAHFFAVDRNGTPLQPQIEVCAPLTDVHMDAVFNWQSPFESASPDTKAPALMAMVQSGMLSQVMTDTRGLVGRLVDKVFGTGESSLKSSVSTFVSQRGAQAQETVDALQGRTGITKLNSVQVFTGMPPLKIQCTALFRAFSDPQSEVEEPFVQLMQWALPQKLAADSIVARLSGQTDDSLGPLAALLPSRAPTLIGFQYKRRLYFPLVIESISEPMSSPIDSKGFYTELAVPMVISTLTALDKDDYAKISQNAPTGATNSSGNSVR
ncbi:hypothetical protein G3N94_20730 [Burkholderia sp. Ac-20353]|nr:hypothetical protein [Burkholderia sp. Ac-20353]